MTVKWLTITGKNEDRSGYFAQEVSKPNGLLIGRRKGEWKGQPYDKVIVNKLLQTTGKQDKKKRKEWKFLTRHTPHNNSYMMVTFGADIIPEFIECLKKIYEDFYGAKPVTDNTDTITVKADEDLISFADSKSKTQALTDKDLELLGG